MSLSLDVMPELSYDISQGFTSAYDDNFTGDFRLQTTNLPNIEVPCDTDLESCNIQLLTDTDTSCLLPVLELADPHDKYVDLLCVDNTYLPYKPDLFDVEMEEMKGTCMMGKQTDTIHVKSGNDGILKLRLNISDVLKNSFNYVNGNVEMLAHLRRTNPQYSDKPVNCVCNKHKSRTTLHNHVLQSCDGEAVYIARNRIHPAVVENILHKPSIQYKLMCNDSCETSREMKVKEKARDMELVLSLLCLKGASAELLSRRVVSVWPKASVNNRDLLKEKRREWKGGNVQAKKGVRDNENEIDADVEALMQKHNIDIAELKKIVDRKVVKVKRLAPKKAGECEPELVTSDKSVGTGKRICETIVTQHPQLL